MSSTTNSRRAPSIVNTQATAHFLMNHGRDARVDKALVRAGKRSAITPEQQLDILNLRLGLRGAAKERNRLQKIINMSGSRNKITPVLKTVAA